MLFELKRLYKGVAKTELKVGSERPSQSASVKYKLIITMSVLIPFIYW